MYYPETAKNATNVYVEREKHQAGAFGRGFERPLSNHQKNRGTPTGNPSRLHSQRKTGLEIQYIDQCKILVVNLA
jgi:hypothetical protein